jgi:lysophospholipase L1-like esterase
MNNPGRQEKQENAMADRQALLKTVKWSLAIALGLLVLLIVLLFGKQPLLLRWFIYSQAQLSRPGMNVTVYNTIDRSGSGQVQRTPGALARLENPNTSLEAYGVWDIKKRGTYTLSFHCDDNGAVFIDGHPVIRLQGISADNQAQAVVPLDSGPHLLVVYLFNGPGKGFFRLEVLDPGQKTPALLSSQQLHPVDLEHSWEVMDWGFTWIRTEWFWAAFSMLLLLTLSFYGARTLKQAGFNGLLFFSSCLLAAVLGEIAVRLFLVPPQKVSFREKAAPGQRTDRRDKAFTLPTERGYRHAPLSELVIENHPWSPKIPLVYKTNSLGYRNPEIGPKRGKRLLFLGDSITFGQGVNEKWTFVRLLENLARAQRESWETINGAVEGLGTNGELAVLNETGLALKPDVVVLDFYLNDFLESPGIFMTRLPGLLDRSWLAHKLEGFFASRLFLTASEKNISVIQPMQKPPDEIFAWRDEFNKNSTVLPPRQTPNPTAQAFHEAVLQNFEDWGGSFSPQVWKKLELLLEEFVRLAQEHRLQFVLIALPVRAQVETAPLFDYPQQRLSRIAQTLNVSYLDLLPVFRKDYEKNRKEEDRLFYDQCHLTVRGHQVTAQAIYQFLKQTPFRNK